MKKQAIIVLTIAGFIAISGCQKEKEVDPANRDVASVLLPAPSEAKVIPGQYIVVLKQNASHLKSSKQATYSQQVAEVQAEATLMLQAQVIEGYQLRNIYAKALKGFCVNLSEADAMKLAKNKDVLRIEPDFTIMRPPWETPDETDPVGQEVPYGIARTGYGDGTGKVAWIIDSGIDLDHPDLNVDVSRSKDFTGSRKGADDENGHGTHCSGTIAAIDNEIGVVGVAAGATVVAVKVLDRKGNGTLSGVIAGIDYVASAASAGDAANMSLGGGVSPTLDEAVIAASNNGIYFSLAAGNESDDADNHSPARANGPNIWTISAMDANDTYAYFSNYGNPPVDFCLPGVNIYSTYLKGGYATMSGTSMAAPHMCGVLLMTNGNPKSDGTVKNDPDGNADSIGHI